MLSINKTTQPTSKDKSSEPLQVEPTLRSERKGSFYPLPSREEEEPSIGSQEF